MKHDPARRRWWLAWSPLIAVAVAAAVWLLTSRAVPPVTVQFLGYEATHSIVMQHGFDLRQRASFSVSNHADCPMLCVLSTVDTNRAVHVFIADLVIPPYSVTNLLCAGSAVRLRDVTNRFGTTFFNGSVQEQRRRVDPRNGPSAYWTAYPGQPWIMTVGYGDYSPLHGLETLRRSAAFWLLQHGLNRLGSLVMPRKLHTFEIGPLPPDAPSSPPPNERRTVAVICASEPCRLT